jgi:hypothetical protein
MNTNNSVDIFETPEHGVVLLCRNLEMADQFEDFLTEHCFVLFNISLNNSEVSFFFGQASALSKVHGLYERFKKLEK